MGLIVHAWKSIVALLATFNWGSIATVMAAVAAFGAVKVAQENIVAKRKDDRRADRLDYVQRQLSQLYGKLLILNETGVRNWQSFLSQYSNDPKKLSKEFKRFFPFDEKDDEPITRFNPSPPNSEQLKAYRKWLKKLFIKTNKRMAAIIYANADLVVGERMPEVFVDFAEHVESLRLLLLKLNKEEINEKKNLIKSTVLDDWREYVESIARHPAGMGYYISAAYEVLKNEQERLLATHDAPRTDKEIAAAISLRQWEMASYWCKREHEARAAVGQAYEYKPVPKPKFG